MSFNTQPTENERLEQISKSKCQYWIINKRKNRSFFCKLQLSNDKDKDDKDQSIYCKHHQKELSNNNNDQKEKKKKKEIIINQQQQQYYKENINGNLPIFNTIPLSNISTIELNEISIKLDNIFNQLFPNGIETYIHQHSSFNQISKIESISKLKHLKQESCILSIIEREGLLKKDSIFLEFGAGSGKLGYHVFSALEKESGHIMIDRQKFKSLKSKDLAIKNEKSCTYFERCLIDIRHFDLKSIPILSNNTQNYTIISKHLCGCATDFTLKCIYNTKKERDLDGFKGIAIATCCHHLCTWDSYINQSFIKDVIGLSEQEFNTLVSITSWATLNKKKKKEEEEEEEEEEKMKENMENVVTTTKIDGVNYDLVFSKERKEELGYKAKRILDHGRLLFIRNSLGLVNSRVQIYTDLSKENLVISGH
ncbi:hypothetical protein DFA_09068 [Cavenderia fasciculata]|uniref:tRNA:m(4)X modification enzyme TRM13 n=1 Tax=Cavenderia fasciculata TaxID=261658 RepID=F4Q6L4_CACFS|nr:uncharacterized protein DFA_09068 [Cavenderia fasciculata]EGG16524.1 hypothetical protein DFA_09068 [Cavenderia fasciculata]|eukprot:XP_004354924.1 hypothetical protein DFA_09068 [Cavenderia fasciculata]